MASYLAFSQIESISWLANNEAFCYRQFVGGKIVVGRWQLGRSVCGERFCVISLTMVFVKSDEMGWSEVQFKSLGKSQDKLVKKKIT